MAKFKFKGSDRFFEYPDHLLHRPMKSPEEFIDGQHIRAIRYVYDTRAQDKLDDLAIRNTEIHPYSIHIDFSCSYFYVGVKDVRRINQV